MKAIRKKSSMLRLVKGTAAGMKIHAEKQVCQQGKGEWDEPSELLLDSHRFSTKELMD